MTFNDAKGLSHLTRVTDLKSTAITFILELAEALKTTNSSPLLLKEKSIALCFFENSTRTRISFEQAIHKLGGFPIDFKPQESSLAKGESFEETLHTLKALEISAIISRHSNDDFSKKIAEYHILPVVNAGDGIVAHPTQALLDSLTLKSKWNSLEGKQILILGDILHSRVARSHYELSQILNYNVKVAGPEEWIPSWAKQSITKDWKSFINDFDAILCLRVQKERMENHTTNDDYLKNYTFRESELKKIKRPYLLHPGPVNWGIELCESALKHPQCLIHEQVRNGLYLRMALLSYLLNPVESKKWKNNNGP
ncbi:MAG: aspartate carbamoyltransferase [Bdellovibrionaceae bacterium]|nr:aspartate carbamoyltransferase [Pseudobdellovibrionaceae bacterium]|tara:strand:+ start:1263 stop:2198 length:936 start_codon:yes stop_codon:yes gene_type:complete